MRLHAHHRRTDRQEHAESGVHLAAVRRAEAFRNERGRYHHAHAGFERVAVPIVRITALQLRQRERREIGRSDVEIVRRLANDFHTSKPAVAIGARHIRLRERRVRRVVQLLVATPPDRCGMVCILVEYCDANCLGTHNNPPPSARRK